MKTSLILCVLLCAGCHTARLPIKPLPEPPPIHGAPGTYASESTVTAPHDSTSDERRAEQDRLIAALAEQNEILTARLQALEHPGDAPATKPPAAPVANVPATPPPPLPTGTPISSTPPIPASASAPPETPPAARETPVDDAPPLVPNADGVVDLTLLDAPPPGSVPNPFALRAPATGAPHELTLAVQGIFCGPSPCALINERVVEPGDLIESLKITRIESDAILLKGDEFNLRLPLGDKPVRVRF
jgi:hypothetical protein